MASRSIRKTTARPRATKAQRAITPSKPDPIFAAIAAHDKACAAIMAYIDRGKDIPPTLGHEKELRALARTISHTSEGVRALGAHIAKWWPEFFSDLARPEIRRTFQSLAKALPASRISAKPDPTFALIQNFEAAWKAFGKVVDEEQRLENKFWKRRDQFPNLLIHNPSFDVGMGSVSFRDEAELDDWAAGERQRVLPTHTPKEWGKLVDKTVALARPRLRAAQRALKRDRDRLGVTPVLCRYDATNAAVNASMLKLVSTPPTTLSGIAALADFAARKAEDHLPENDAKLCFATIARAAERLTRGRS